MATIKRKWLGTYPRPNLGAGNPKKFIFLETKELYRLIGFNKNAIKEGTIRAKRLKEAEVKRLLNWGFEWMDTEGQILIPPNNASILKMPMEQYKQIMKAKYGKQQVSGQGSGI